MMLAENIMYWYHLQINAVGLKLFLSTQNFYPIVICMPLNINPSSTNKSMNDNFMLKTFDGRKKPCKK